MAIESSLQDIAQLLVIVERKYQFDQQHKWGGAHRYLDDIKKEVDEVEEELPRERWCFLEDELADILWNYLNAMNALQHQNKITIESVFARAYRKYEQRVSAIEGDESWQAVKQRQKQQLQQEFEKQPTVVASQIRD